MVPRIVTAVLLGLLVAATVVPGRADELSGYAAIETAWFPKDPLYPDQKDSYASFVLNPEYCYQWKSGNMLTIEPFVRYDSTDGERSHLDLREFYFLCIADRWELKIGIAKVFWGVTEFVHLIDIINQTDLVENIDQEDKLGQPMLNLFLHRDWGNLDLYVMPWFRERTFPGAKGRFRPDPPVSNSLSRYESGAEDHHLDLALRYSKTIGDWNLGIYHFKGTGREPDLMPAEEETARNALSPYYYQIDQTGLDALWVVGEWLWKLEMLHRTDRKTDYYALTGGFEYTIPSIGATPVDLGLILEWAYDERGDAATTPFDDDAMLGLRIAFNDFSSTEMRLGWIKDLNTEASYATIKAERRIGDHVKASVEGWLFCDPPNDDPFYALRQDDHLRFTLFYYF